MKRGVGGVRGPSGLKRFLVFFACGVAGPFSHLSFPPLLLYLAVFFFPLAYFDFFLCSGFFGPPPYVAGVLEKRRIIEGGYRKRAQKEGRNIECAIEFAKVTGS